MSKKSFNDIEQIIKAAAGAHEPPFDEASWKKMEMLLDKEKDRRKPFFRIFRFALPAVFIIAAILLYQQFNRQAPVNISGRNTEKNTAGKIQPDTKKPTPLAVIPQHEQAVATGQQPDEVKANLPLVKPRNQNKHSESTGNLSGNQKKYDEFTGQNKGNKNFRLFRADQKTGILIQGNLSGNQAAETNPGTGNEYTQNKQKLNASGKLLISITAPAQLTENEVNPNAHTQKTKDGLDIVKTGEPGSLAPKLKNAPAGNAAPDPEKQDTLAIAMKSKTDKDKKKKTFSGLYVTATAGAEASGTRFLSFSNSTITPRYGFGIGYRVSKKISVQAGFYAAAKKYVAGPGDYSLKSGSYLSMVQIKEIKANCMVYEIPVSVQYNLVIKPKTVYYLSAGLSAYLMKKEDYDFTVVRNNTLYTYPYYYKKNSHLLAALNLSAGVEKKIVNKLYLQVAPFVNIPLGGVGEGKVKLYTTGLNMGLKYFPFKK